MIGFIRRMRCATMVASVSGTSVTTTPMPRSSRRGTEWPKAPPARLQAHRWSCWIDVAAMADNAFDDDTVTDAVFDCADRLAGGHSDAVGPRLEFSISEISSFGG